MRGSKSIAQTNHDLIEKLESLEKAAVPDFIPDNSGNTSPVLTNSSKQKRNRTKKRENDERAMTVPRRWKQK